MNFTYKSLSGLSESISSNNSDESILFRNDLPRMNFCMPFDWSLDPFKDSNWCFQLNCWRSADHRLLKFFETKDSSHILYMAEVMLDWYRHHYIDAKVSSHAWYDMAVGIRASRIAFLLVTSKDYPELDSFCKKHSAEIDVMVSDHIKELSDKTKLNMGNHGIFQMNGLMLLCKSIGKFDDAYDFSRNCMSEILSTQFTSQGIHTENSPEYHYFVLNTLEYLKIFENFDKVIDLDVVKTADINKFWFTCPNKDLVNFGDTNGRGPIVKYALLNNWEILGKNKKFVFADFTDSGYLFCRSEPYGEESDYLAVACSGHTTVHKHADVGSVILWVNGVEVLTDAGKYKYGKSPERKLVTSAVSHSVSDFLDSPLNAASYLLPATGSYCNGITFKDDLFSMKVSYETVFDKGFVREIIYKPDGYLSIYDSFPEKCKGKMVSRLQINPDIKISRESADEVILSDDDGKVKLRVKASSSISVDYVDKGRSKKYGELGPVTRLIVSDDNNSKVDWCIEWL